MCLTLQRRPGRAQSREPMQLVRLIFASGVHTKRRAEEQLERDRTGGGA